MTPTLAWLLLATVAGLGAFLYAIRAGIFARFSHGFLVTVIVALVGLGLLTAGLQGVIDSQLTHLLVFNGLANGMSATGSVVQAQIQDDAGSFVNVMSRMSQTLSLDEARQKPADLRHQFANLKTFHQLLMQMAVVDRQGHTVVSLFPMQQGAPLPPDALSSIRQGSFYISDPWMAKYFRRWFVTLAVPIWDEQHQVAGALVCNYDLQDMLRTIIVPAHFGKSGFSILTDYQGKVLAHPDLAHVGEDLSSYAAVQNGIKGESGWLTGKDSAGKDWVFVYRPIESPATQGNHHWTLLIQTSPAEALAPIRKLRREFIIGMGVFLVLSILLALEVSVSTVKPLNRLLQFVRAVREGHLDQHVPIRGRDEVNQLGGALNEMADALRQREEMERILDEQRAQGARIESELQIARQTQLGLLPHVFNLPHHPVEVDIHASIEPAREVGGDFYDVIHLKDGRVGVVIGDVSGKGVPASLHMAITKSLIEATARHGALAPNEVLERVNQELARNNEQMVFITVFLAILDPATGILTYSNAGHNPPLLLREGGRVELVSGRGVALGVDEDATYVQWTIPMQPQDSLLLYTDGVTEAFNPQEEMFDETGLKTAMAGMRGHSSRDLVQQIVQAVQTFADGAPQSDDLTLMAIRYCGRESTPAGSGEQSTAAVM